MFRLDKSSLLMMLLVVYPHLASAQEILVETLFKKPEFSSIALSPNTKLLAAIAPYKGRNNLVVLDLDKKSLNRVTGATDTDIERFFWLGNGRLIFTTGDQQGFEFRGNGGVYAIDADGINARELNKPSRAKANDGQIILRLYAPIGPVRGSTDDIYVNSNERSSDSNDIYRVNTRTGRKTLITFDTPGKVDRWVFDKDQVARAALTQDRKAMTAAFFYRTDDKSPWQKMHEWDLLDEEITPEAFDRNGRLYVSSNVGRDTKALYEYDIAGKKLGKLIYGDDHYDLAPPTVWGGGRVGIRFASDDADDQVIGISYATDKPKTVWFDEKFAQVQAELDRTFPGAVNTFGAIKDQMLVRTRSDRNPGTVYMFDRVKPSLTELLRFREWIKPEQMNEMKPITFTARDGMRIEGYITLPKSYKAGSPVPMIVHPHGGPWARDGWGFNPEVQFMANRGYAVLQVNFRNSTGYGMKLLRGGYKQWGEKTQDDIYDGAMWAIKEGFADKARVGVYGASFGGYSTLMQLVRYPELYKFGINYVGVTDMFVHQETQPAQKLGDFGDLAKRANGDAKVDRDMFERTSPTLQVKKIRAPVMHAYGGEDRNVDVANGDAVKKAFERAGLPVDYTFVAEEGHGYREDANVFMFYNKFDAFMRRHLPTK